MTRKRRKPDKAFQQQTSFVRDFKPKTKGQEEYIRAIAENTVVLCQGLAGTGKTACAIASACNCLIYGDIKKIIITRPIIETGSSMGFLPGTALEKMHEYIVPCLEELNDFFGQDKINELLYNKSIEIIPLNFMRGRNFHNSFLIVDEAQNCWYEQLKMAISRIGKNSKCIMNGDITQSDLAGKLRDDYRVFCEKLVGVESVSHVYLNHQDIVRNPIISNILAKL